MENSPHMRVINETRAVSRRRFIKGVIAGGAAVGSAGYLFRASTLAPTGAPADRLISINVNGQSEMTPAQIRRLPRAKFYPRRRLHHPYGLPIY